MASAQASATHQSGPQWHAGPLRVGTGCIQRRGLTGLRLRSGSTPLPKRPVARLPGPRAVQAVQPAQPAQPSRLALDDWSPAAWRPHRPQARRSISAGAAASGSQPIEGDGEGKATGGNPLALSDRWKVVFTMFLAFILCNMDKVNMSVAVIPMATDLGWSATDRGLVSSSFFWGYSLTQIPAGYLATKLGGARVLLAGVLLWSFGTMIAPPASQMGLAALCATRVLVGLGEGLAPSAATNVLATTVPVKERARAVSTVFGGLDVGSAVGLLLCGPLIFKFGWPSVFYVFAGLGFLWCVLWPRLRIPLLKEPKASTESGDTQEKAYDKIPWLAFFKTPAVWAIIIAHFCFNWGYYTLLAWLPSYFELALGLDVSKSSMLTLIPYIAMSSMTPMVGPVADGMVERGVSVTMTRKLCQGLAFLGPALCMLSCGVLTPTSGVATNAPVLVALLSIAFALSAWSRAGLYCNHQDLSPKYASVLLGITNTFGAFPGILGVASAGLLLDATNSWAIALFYPTAACQLFGLVMYSLLCSAKPREEWA